MTKGSRRNFLQKTLVAGSAAGLAAMLPSCGNESGNDFSQMFIHHVFFWMKDPDNKSSMEKFKSELNKLVTIETIQFTHLGMPAVTNREVIDNTYHFSLLLAFSDKAGQDIYQDHEKHLIFIEECKDLWERVLVYDSISI